MQFILITLQSIISKMLTISGHIDGLMQERRNSIANVQGPDSI